MCVRAQHVSAIIDQKLRQLHKRGAQLTQTDAQINRRPHTYHIASGDALALENEDIGVSRDSRLAELLLEDAF